jgi:serine/threonine-protein kinase
MADSPVKEGQVLAGKYRVERVLGSGGMGVVVAAWHLELEQRVAVKFLHPLAMERADTAERFRREARSAAKIRSEHVARVIDVGIMEGGIPYMVMEYLEGHDVSDEMSKIGMLPIEEAVDFILQAIEALAEAHAAGIVHRDLKPANLFIASRPDGTRIVKVLDFGISKSLLGGSASELSLTRTSVLIGSPLYMSPEQMRSAKDVDTRTDIWSLGVILYEMITGRPPYTGDSIPALCASLLNDVPQSMRALRADVPAELEDVIRYCMAKDRADRYGTVSELARALAQFGSIASQLHVDRASRVLGVTEVSVLSDSSDRRLRSADASGRARAVSLQPVPVVEPVPATVDSWGRTDSPITGDTNPKPKSRGLLFAVVGLGAVAVVSAALFLRSRSPSTPPAASASVAGPTPPAQMPSPLSETRAPVVTEPVAPVAPEPVVVPSAVAPDPAAPVVRPQEPKALPKPVIQAPAALFKPKPAATPPKAASSNELSDFGGRR